MSVATKAIQQLINEALASRPVTYAGGHRRDERIMALRDAEAAVAQAETARDALVRKMLAETDIRMPSETLPAVVSGPSLKDRYIETPSMIPEFPEPHRARIGG